MKPLIEKYLESWSSELLSRADRVRSLIGDAHWLSDGHHKESIIKEFLERNLPRSLIISRGFLLSTTQPTQVSTEIDVLVTDPRLQPPLFFEGGLQIATPASVVAYLEIKSSFQKNSLVAALKSQSCIQKAFMAAYPERPSWRGILFAAEQQSRKPDSILETIAASIKESWLAVSKVGQEHGPIQPVTPFPTSIATFSSFVAFVSHDLSAQTCRIRLFNAGKLSLACAMADLISYVSNTSTGLDEVIESLPFEPPLVSELDLSGGGK